MRIKEVVMIELTEEQRQAVHDHPGQPLPMVDPATQQTFVLIQRDLYESLTEYDDSEWTDEELDLLAVEVDAMLDDDMAIEDTEAARGHGHDAVCACCHYRPHHRADAGRLALRRLQLEVDLLHQRPDRPAGAGRRVCRGR